MQDDTSALAAELAALEAKATPGPWDVIYYDAGDRAHYDNCPSIQAPESEDCAVIHWDGFKQKYWTSANGDQRQIDANAALIVALRNNLPAILAALNTRPSASVEEVERVALAISEHTYATVTGHSDCLDWPDMSESDRVKYRIAARAAIAALRAGDGR